MFEPGRVRAEWLAVTRKHGGSVGGAIAELEAADWACSCHDRGCGASVYTHKDRGNLRWLHVLLYLDVVKASGVKTSSEESDPPPSDRAGAEAQNRLLSHINMAARPVNMRLMS